MSVVIDDNDIKTAFGHLLLRADTNPLVKRALNAFDPSASAKRTVNYKALNQFSSRVQSSLALT